MVVIFFDKQKWVVFFEVVIKSFQRVDVIFKRIVSYYQFLFFEVIYGFDYEINKVYFFMDYFI